jgi:coatomer subunit beta
VKSAIKLLLQGEKMDRILMHVIRFCITCDDHQLKKLLMLYWEVVPKHDENKKLLPEMILVCNALRNDLNSPNEYVRGSMLRFLCKLKEPELLEPLIASIKANLEHRHSYVRRTAVLAIFSIYAAFGAELLPDGPELVDEFLKKEGDISARRNAFLMLFNSQADLATEFLLDNMDQVPKFGDGFSLVILELTRKVCRSDPSQKGKFLRCIFNMLNSDSAAVSYEAAWTLVSLSTAPTAIRAAASTYTTLLNQQSDNNVKLIVLDRLKELKKSFRKVLQEVLMDMMRALTSPNLEIKKRVLDIAMDLLQPNNIDEVIMKLKQEIVKTQDKNLDGAADYRKLLIEAIHSCATKYPEVAENVVNLLMDFLSGEGSNEVILFVRAIIDRYQHLREGIITKLLQTLGEIKSTKVLRVALWIIGEYCEDADLISEGFAALKEHVGSLPFTNAAEKKKEVEAPSNAPVAQTKTVVLEDGTYATQTAITEEVKPEKEDEMAHLRKSLIKDCDYFLGTCLTSSMAKLALRTIGIHGENASVSKNMVIDAMKTGCAIIQLGERATQKHQIDADSRERIVLCIKVLSMPAASNVLRETMLNECRQSFSAMLDAQDAADAEQEKDTEVQAQADDLISWRQLREKTIGGGEIDFDDAGDIARANAGEDANKKVHVYQLSGFSDPVYAEAYLTIHSYDIVLEILVINHTPHTLQNLTVELSTMGDIKIVERPQNYTVGPMHNCTIRTNIKVSSMEAGHIFGTIVYDSATGVESKVINLNDIHLDIMDYIVPATCSHTQFRSMWAEFEWENKVAVNTVIDDLDHFLSHIVKQTRMVCLTPRSKAQNDTMFLAANLYARSMFGEDALVNVSVEKLEGGKINGYIRIRSKTQGIALSLGDRISSIQRTLSTEETKVES